MLKRFFCLLLALMFFASAAAASDIPEYKGYVNDLAGLLGSEEVISLENKLKSYDEQTSNHISILIIKSLQGSDIESYSIRVVEKWKIGKEKKDNGVLILVAKNDRKIRIEVGRGLEGSLTDLISGRIIDGIMEPSFKKGNFYKGIDDAVNAVELAVKGEFKADDVKLKSGSDAIAVLLTSYFFILVVAGFAGFVSEFLGAAVGGVGFFFVTMWIFNSLEWAIATAAVGAILGAFARFFMENIGSGSYSSSGGGSFSGGDSGGFGGGFGGGGASGGW